MWLAHEPLANQSGVSEGAIEAVAGRTQPTGETKTEALVVRYGREPLRENRVSDGTFRAARNHLDVRGVVELTATFGYYAMIACVRNAFEVTPKEGAPTFQ